MPLTVLTVVCDVTVVNAYVSCNSMFDTVAYVAAVPEEGPVAEDLVVSGWLPGNRFYIDTYVYVVAISYRPIVYNVLFYWMVTRCCERT